jgi:hypothetical protein
MLSRVMQKRATRWTLLVVLLLAAGAGAFYAAPIVREHESQLAASPAVDSAIAAITTTVNDIGAAQATYIAPGINSEPSMARVAALGRQVSDATAALRPALRSPEAPRHLQDLANTLDNLLQIDLHVREALVDDDFRGSSLLIFGDGQSAIRSIQGTLRALADAEHTASASARLALLRQLGTIGASVAGLWLLGLLLLVPSARPRQVAVEPSARPEPAPLVDLRLDAVPEEAAVSAAVAAPPVSAAVPAAPPVIDLAAAANVCTAIARASRSDELPDLLADTAIVLDASGVILWLGAGDELFPAAAYGYDPKVLSRVGPIRRQSDNATAAAWRNGELAVVPGDAPANGAIVAPLLGADACIGVFAAEIRHGLETDGSARAVATMFAAQLTTIVSPWLAVETTGHAGLDGESDAPLAASL